MLGVSLCPLGVREKWTVKLPVILFLRNRDGCTGEMGDPHVARRSSWCWRNNCWRNNWCDLTLHGLFFAPIRHLHSNVQLGWII